MEEVVVVKNLSKSYGNVQAVANVSFSVHRGEIFGLLGPNGAGKTTTIECILGTRRPDKGEIQILGLNPLSDRRRLYARVGVQFQDSAWQTGIRVDEICMATACLYEPQPDWYPLLKKFDLTKLLRQPVSVLSGGERQKLSILLACLHSPELIFLDELTTGLDPLARREVWRFIQLLRDEGISIILSSHYMDEVETLCSRALVLKDGRTLACDSITALVAAGSGRNLDESYIQLLEAQ
jgi:ABC-2 type transport system ATP-binding protein